MVCPACGTGVQDGARWLQWMRTSHVLIESDPHPSERISFVRARGRVIAGVCAGLRAQAYGWDPVIVRIVLCLIALCGAGTPIIAYLIAWIVMPNYEYPHRTDLTNS